MGTVNEITTEHFKAATGHRPVNDDMHRSNCTRAGIRGHTHCGWCIDCELPVFMCGHTIEVNLTTNRRTE